MEVDSEAIILWDRARAGECRKVRRLIVCGKNERRAQQDRKEQWMAVASIGSIVSIYYVRFHLTSQCILRESQTWPILVPVSFLFGKCQPLTVG